MTRSRNSSGLHNKRLNSVKWWRSEGNRRQRKVVRGILAHMERRPIHGVEDLPVRHEMCNKWDLWWTTRQPNNNSPFYDPSFCSPAVEKEKTSQCWDGWPHDEWGCTVPSPTWTEPTNTMLLCLLLLIVQILLDKRAAVLKLNWLMSVTVNKQQF